MESTKVKTLVTEMGSTTLKVSALDQVNLKRAKIEIEIPVFSGNSAEDVDNLFYKLDN